MSSPLKQVVVTGASRGIGRSISLRFAQQGYEVWAMARSFEALLALETEAATTGGKIRPLRLDVERADDVLSAVQIVLEAGVPSVLVNNAGIAISSSLEKTELESFEKTMAVNVTAPFLLCRALMPAMAKAGGGRVINIASTAAVKGFRYTSAYCASKHALLGLTRALAVEYAAKHVTVNAVCPGWTDTEMVAASTETISRVTGKSRAEARSTLEKMNPMGRLISPGEVAELCLYLASPMASAITGGSYLIDGGESV